MSGLNGHPLIERVVFYREWTGTEVRTYIQVYANIPVHPNQPGFADGPYNELMEAVKHERDQHEVPHNISAIQIFWSSNA